MYSIILAAVLALQGERAYFKIEVETNTCVSLSINGQKIDKDRWYKTEPLTESVTVEVVARYVSGGQVKEHIFYLELDPGERCTFKIELWTIPPLVLAC